MLKQRRAEQKRKQCQIVTHKNDENETTKHTTNILQMLKTLIIPRRTYFDADFFARILRCCAYRVRCAYPQVAEVLDEHAEYVREAPAYRIVQ